MLIFTLFIHYVMPFSASRPFIPSKRRASSRWYVQEIAEDLEHLTRTRKGRAVNIALNCVKFEIFTAVTMKNAVF
jgi:hypothetical protein